jgi:hypothetical protein
MIKHHNQMSGGDQLWAMALAVLVFPVPGLGIIMGLRSSWYFSSSLSSF